MSEFNHFTAGMSTEHRCGDYPTPKTSDEFIECGCGKLWVSSILDTMRNDQRYIYYWKRPDGYDIKRGVRRGLDPKHLRWWHRLA